MGMIQQVLGSPYCMALVPRILHSGYMNFLDFCALDLEGHSDGQLGA